MFAIPVVPAVHWTEPLPRRELPQLDASQAWLIAVLFYGLGDVVTTSIGLGTGGVSEANPIAALLFHQSPLTSMVLLKLAAFGICYGLWKRTPHPYSVGVPAGLAFFGVLITVWNTHVLLIATLP